MMIEPLSKNKLAYIKSLQQSKFRQKYRKFIVEGYKSVSEFLKNKKFPLELVVSSDNASIANHNIPNNKIFLCKDSEMKTISNLTNPTPILAVFEMLEYDISRCLSSPLPIFLLDGIQDPGNFGTIIRTADWFGIKSVISTKHTVDFFHPKVVQATMGSLNNVEFCTIDDLNIFKNYNKTIIGMDMNGIDLRSFEVRNDYVFVLGSEGKGLSPELITLCSQFVSIGGVENRVAESLNVGVTASILAYKLAIN